MSLVNDQFKNLNLNNSNNSEKSDILDKSIEKLDTDNNKIIHN